MTEMNRPPDLAQDFILIHKVITRGLGVGINKGGEYIKTGFPTPELKRGFIDYIQTLAVVVKSHHTGEDEVVFPALKQKVTGAPYLQLALAHKEISSLLDNFKKGFNQMSESDNPENFAYLIDQLQKLSFTWAPHIRSEEFHFSKPALAAALSVEEHGRISGAWGKHNQEHAEPASMALPFMLYNLAPEDRAEMAAGMPVMVTEELVPKTWKDQWSSMKPFLLD